MSEISDESKFWNVASAVLSAISNTLRFSAMPAPGASQSKANDLRLRYMSCSCFSSFQDEFSTARLTLEE